jgi:hypothetical protein
MVGLNGDWHIYAGTQGAFGRAPPRVPVTTQWHCLDAIAVGQGVLTRRRCRATRLRKQVVRHAWARSATHLARSSDRNDRIKATSPMTRITSHNSMQTEYHLASRHRYTSAPKQPAERLLATQDSQRWHEEGQGTHSSCHRWVVARSRRPTRRATGRGRSRSKAPQPAAPLPGVGQEQSVRPAAPFGGVVAD